MSTPRDPARPERDEPSPWQRPAVDSPADGPSGLGGAPPYEPAPSPYEPARPPYEPAPPPYEPARPPYEPARPPYDPARPPYDPARPPYDPASSPGFTPPGYGAASGPVPPGYGPPSGPAPPGYGPPPYGTPPVQPARSSRRVLALVGALAMVAVVLVGVLAFVVFRGNPRDTADAFMSALRAKDVDKAHSLLCKDGQQKESKEELRRSFDLDQRTITGYQLGTERERRREGKDETLIPVTITYDQGTEVRIDLGIWNEGGQRICSLNPPGG